LGRLTASCLSEEPRFWLRDMTNSSFLKLVSSPASVEGTFGGGHAHDPRIQRACLTQRTRQSFEGYLDDVMQVFSLDQVHVQIAAESTGEAFKKHFGQLAVPGPNFCLR